MIRFKTFGFVGEGTQAFGRLFLTVRLWGLRRRLEIGSVFVSEILQLAGSIWCVKPCYCLLRDRRSISRRSTSSRVLRSRRSR